MPGGSTPSGSAISSVSSTIGIAGIGCGTGGRNAAGGGVGTAGGRLVGMIMIRS
jgi:hypothetical protein